MPTCGPLLVLLLTWSAFPVVVVSCNTPNYFYVQANLSEHCIDLVCVHGSVQFCFVGFLALICEVHEKLPLLFRDFGFLDCASRDQFVDRIQFVFLPDPALVSYDRESCFSVDSHITIQMKYAARKSATQADRSAMYSRMVFMLFSVDWSAKHCIDLAHSALPRIPFVEY